MAMGRNISDLTAQQQALLNNLSSGVNVDPAEVLDLLGVIEQEFYISNPQFQTSNWNWGAETINGRVPLGNLEAMEGDEPAIDTVIDGKRLIVNVGIRKAGTRVGIHVHESGGLTFVMGEEGAITDFVEGFPERTFPTGTYYYMPYNTPMSASNLTNSDVQLIDIFYFPVDGLPITIIEEGYPGYNPPPYFETASFVSASSDYLLVGDESVQEEFAQFEIQGGVNNQRSSYVDFSAITEHSRLDLGLETAGGGSIRDALPSYVSGSSALIEVPFFNGIYYNSGAGGDNIDGSSFNDFVRSNSGDDFVASGLGDDVVLTGDGNDLIESAIGHNIIIAGAGYDTVSYLQPLSMYQIEIQERDAIKFLKVYEKDDGSAPVHQDCLFEVESLQFTQGERVDVRELLGLNVQRLYNPQIDRELYTSSTREIEILTGLGWFNEKAFFVSPFSQDQLVYRFYIPSEDRHFYTALKSERDLITGNDEVFSGWQYEGPAFSAYSTDSYLDGAVAIVRFLNLETGVHLYSTNVDEQILLDGDINWLNEGVAWYGDPVLSVDSFV